MQTASIPWNPLPNRGAHHWLLTGDDVNCHRGSTSTCVKSLTDVTGYQKLTPPQRLSSHRLQRSLEVQRGRLGLAICTTGGPVTQSGPPSRAFFFSPSPSLQREDRFLHYHSRRSPQNTLSGRCKILAHSEAVE